jgi:pimeloyl-ACP methyl ester carboxylesterase
MGELIVTVADAFGLSRPHVVAPGTGTPAALFAAARHPGRLRSLVIGGGAAAVPLELGGMVKDIIEAPTWTGSATATRVGWLALRCAASPGDELHDMRDVAFLHLGNVEAWRAGGLCGWEPVRYWQWRRKPHAGVPMTLPMPSKIFTIFEGTSEIQRMIVGRAVTGGCAVALNCGYT